MSRFTTNITKSKKIKSKKQPKEISVAILSAGIGSRIKSYEPRCMLKIGGKTLMEHQIATIKKSIDNPDIISVIGYDAQKVIRKFNDQIKIIENQIYENTNTSESIRLAFNATKKNNFLFIHGDLLFNQDTLSDLDYNRSFVIIDTKQRIDDKEVGLTILGNKKASIFSYGLDTKWCQIAFFTGKEINIAKQIFNKFEDYHKKMLSFEILNQMINMGASFNCYEPDGMKILEIDRIKDIG